MPKTKYTIQFSRRAERGYVLIQRHTAKKYGKKRVFKYLDALDALDAGMKRLAENPLLYGHSRPDIPKQYKSYKVGEHSIVYRVDDKKIFIVAILHGRMNFTEQLQ